MNQHEREFFVSYIRTGNTIVKTDKTYLVIKPLTIEQSFHAEEVYRSAYDQAFVDGMMSEQEMLEWMMSNGLWSEEDEKKADGFKNDLEKLKVEIYKSRNNDRLRETIRLYIRAGEKQFSQHMSKKYAYNQNTAEGYAATEKVSWIIKNSTYYNNELYDFSEHGLPYVIEEWQASFLNDHQIRELARNEPWKSLWIVKENAQIRLFKNSEDSELTYNQKNLIIWSQMYDNIQESLDCPAKDVIEDDDLLDGWFIIQSKKREQEKAEHDMNELMKSKKIQEASEVFVMAGNKNEADRINRVNSTQSMAVKQQRAKTLKEKGSVNHHDFVDQRQKIQMEQNNLFKGTIKGGR